MRTGVVVLATPEVAGLPYVISGLVAAWYGCSDVNADGFFILQTLYS